MPRLESRGDDDAQSGQTSVAPRLCVDGSGRDRKNVRRERCEPPASNRLARLPAAAPGGVRSELGVPIPLAEGKAGVLCSASAPSRTAARLVTCWSSRWRVILVILTKSPRRTRSSPAATRRPRLTRCSASGTASGSMSPGDAIESSNRSFRRSNPTQLSPVWAVQPHQVSAHAHHVWAR